MLDIQSHTKSPKCWIFEYRKNTPLCVKLRGRENSHCIKVAYVIHVCKTFEQQIITLKSMSPLENLF